MTEAEITTRFFERWENQFAGRFLARSGDLLTPDAVEMVNHVPRLSHGEKVYAAAWWELTRTRPAPWLDTPSLSQLHAIDADHRQSIIDLVVGLNQLWLQREIGGLR
jgi:hypothetical protein